MKIGREKVQRRVKSENCGKVGGNLKETSEDSMSKHRMNLLQNCLDSSRLLLIEVKDKLRSPQLFDTMSNSRDYENPSTSPQAPQILPSTCTVASKSCSNQPNLFKPTSNQYSPHSPPSSLSSSFQMHSSASDKNDHFQIAGHKPPLKPISNELPCKSDTHGMVKRKQTATFNYILHNVHSRIVRFLLNGNGEKVQLKFNLSCFQF
jgi:hypothetical protein